MTADVSERRDRALLLLGFAALRRSELVALDVEDLAFDASSRGLLAGLPLTKLS